MLLSDATWLAEALRRFEAKELSPLINLGSSTRAFREQTQPFIHRLVFAPLAARGVQIVHCDLKEADGVDVAGDIFSDPLLARLKALQPKAVLCTHMMEHVSNREELARRMLDILVPGGLFFVTAPKSYHHHADPIDTMFRPTPEELAALFPAAAILEKRVLQGGSYRDHFRRRPVTLFFRHFFRFLVPFFGFKKWKRSMRKLFWLFHPYEVSAVLGRKTAMTAGASLLS